MVLKVLFKRELPGLIRDLELGGEADEEGDEDEDKEEDEDEDP